MSASKSGDNSVGKSWEHRLPVYYADITLNGYIVFLVVSCFSPSLLGKGDNLCLGHKTFSVRDIIQ